MSAIALMLFGIVLQVGAGPLPGQAKNRAQALLAAGANLYERGDLAGALEKFRAAFAAYPSPKLQFNLGQVYRDLGRPLEAREAFNLFLMEAVDAPAGMKAEAGKALVDVESRLGRVEISASIDGAQISIDGQLAGTSPILAPVWVTPGEHQVVARQIDAESLLTFRVEAGRSAKVSLVFVRGKQALPADSANQGDRTPQREPQPLTARVFRPDTPALAAFPLRDEPALGATSTARPRTPLPRWVPVVGAAATIALAAAAVSFGISADSRYDSLKASCGQTAAGCSSDQTAVVRSRDYAANVCWALAGTAAVATGLSVFVNTREAGISSLWHF